MYLSPCRTAVVLIPATSEPACGSVIASAPTNSPAMAFGKYFSFRKSLASCFKCDKDKYGCAEILAPKPPELDLDTSSMKITSYQKSRLEPPYFSSCVMPK